MRSELSRLPAENHSCLVSLLSLCREIAKHSDATGIAFELGPLTLRRKQQGDDADMESLAIEFLVLLIEHHDVFFSVREGTRAPDSIWDLAGSLAHSLTRLHRTTDEGRYHRPLHRNSNARELDFRRTLGVQLLTLSYHIYLSSYLSIA